MLDWPTNEQARYIRGFGDGEGSVINSLAYKKVKDKRYQQRNRTIKFSNTNKENLIIIKKMLEKMDIESHIYIDTRAGIRRATIDSWSLVICGKVNFIRFDRLIGFSDKQKAKKLKKMILSYKR